MKRGRHGVTSGNFSLGVAALLAANACAPAPAPTASRGSAQPLPVVALDEKPAFPLAKHLESKDIAAGAMTYAQLFEDGAKLFHTSYNGLDGVGMMRTLAGAPVNRFTVVPPGGGHPVAIGAQSCGGCHGLPTGAGFGLANTRILNDAAGKGAPPFNIRDTITLYGDGVLQRVAEEMTEQLLAGRDAAVEEAKASPGTAVRKELRANDVAFGALVATANPAGEVTFNMSEVRGVSPDLVIRPFGWKGTVTSVRNFSTAASTFGLGMMAEEFVWRLGEKAGPDPDGDGVTRELSVGDVTAMTVYDAGQAVPAEAGRLAELGYVAALDASAKDRIEKGRTLFSTVGCASCHVTEMHLTNTVFEEPTLRGGGNYLDGFLASKDPDYDPKRPVRFDLLKDSQAPRLEAAANGGGTVRLYGDLKRHDMGRRLMDPGGPSAPLSAALAPLEHNGKVALVSPSEFLTPELWGVGTTGPYLHDDRAGTITEAIMWHGEDSPPSAGQPGRSEAQEARDAFAKLAPEEQSNLVAFLKSLVAYSTEPRR